MKIIGTFSFFLFFFTPGLRAQDKEVYQDISLQDPVISLKYTRGKHLIYDCKAHHWVCASQKDYKSCLKSRDYEVKEKASEFSCIPTKVFESLKSCVKKQKSIISYGYAVDSCKSSF